MAITTVLTPVPWPDQPGLLEPKRGYRFKVESLLIADLVPPGAQRILDLGAGCGVLGIAASHHSPDAVLTLVERNSDLAELARHNLIAHGRVGEVVEADLRDVCLDGLFDLIVTNPPFFVPGHGRASRSPMVREATHAYHGDIVAFVRVAARHLSRTGSLWVVYPAEALARVVESTLEVGLHVRTTVLVHARHKGAPFRVWCEACHESGPHQTITLSAMSVR